MLDSDYYISIVKSYGRTLSRREWDALPSSIPSSKEIINALGQSRWEDVWRICGFDDNIFSRDEMLSFGRKIGLDIKEISPERWDALAKELKNKKIIIPSSSAILREYSEDWKHYQNAVVCIQQSPKQNYLKKLERLFLAGNSTINIARKLGRQIKHARKDLESLGLFTAERLADNFPTVDSIMHRPLEQFKSYCGEQKQQARSLISDAVKKISEPKNLRYCGLPGPQFIDYIQLHDAYNIMPDQSLAAERDKIAGNFMISVRRWWNVIEGGERFRKLKIYRGPIEKALGIETYSDMKFNLINFDWTGGWAKNKKEAITNLFERNHLMNEALLFITLNDSAYERARAEGSRGYVLSHKGSDSHIKIASDSIKYNAHRRFREVKELFAVPYKDSQDMITAGYLIRKYKNE